MKYRVAICGSYGGLNLGDEAILEVILRELRAHLDIDVVVFSRNPRNTARRHRVRAVPVREMHKDDILNELRKLDLFILGGGGILFDGSIEKFLRHAVISKMANAQRANVLKGRQLRRHAMTGTLSFVYDLNFQ